MTNTTRRDFLKTSSSAALGSALLTGISARAHASQDETIRIGLVGCGGRGTGAAGQALSTAGRVKLVALGDAFQDQLDRSLKVLQRAVANKSDAEIAVDLEHQFVGFDAYRKVIDSDVDLVILATPPGFRPIHFDYAVQQGKHVFMEKPVATDAPGVRQVLAAARTAKETGLKIGVGLQRRHQPVYQDFIKRIHDGAIGDIRALRVYWNEGGVWEPRVTREQVKSEMEYQMRNWYYYNWLCGDHIVEQHIHNIDVGNWIMQSQLASGSSDLIDQYPVSAQGMGGREVRTDPKYGEIFDHHAVEFTYADGTVMFSQCRHIRSCWNSVSEHAHGTKGTVHLEAGNPRNNKIELAGGKTIKYEGGSSDPYQIEHDKLFHAIRNSEDYDETERGALATMTAILGRMCTYSGKSISMVQALHDGLGVMPKQFAWDAAPPRLPDENGRYPIPVPGVTKVLG